jgi:hypothetical protein
LRNRLRRLLWRQSLGSAGNYNSVADGPLEQPVLVSITSDSSVDASLAKVKVATLADTAMIVFIWNRRAAVVAVDCVRSRREVADGWECWQAIDVICTVHNWSLGSLVGGVDFEIESPRNSTFRRVLTGLLE